MGYKFKITRKNGRVVYLRVYNAKDQETQMARLRTDKSVQSVKVLAIPASR